LVNESSLLHRTCLAGTEVVNPQWMNFMFYVSSRLMSATHQANDKEVAEAHRDSNPIMMTSHCLMMTWCCQSNLYLA